ncbi:hypothetical protein GCM10025876_00410 [Demequina litorisediminis]|uniref:Uncharacterized protein n=1 Tax=Demequina litorisediminis TaxID=1849022 RepID=A0ABQ6I7N2_9MICO|nr:hypothetical protein GCM10025876_00410 [Demequina litorisediminis]
MPETAPATRPSWTASRASGAWFYEGNTSDGTGTNSDRGVFHRWRSLYYMDAVFDPRDYYDAVY